MLYGSPVAEAIALFVDVVLLAVLVVVIEWVLGDLQVNEDE